MEIVNKKLASGSATSTDVHETLRRIASRYPPALAAQVAQDIDRQAFHVDIALSAAGPTGRLADIGGGIGMFSLCCAHLGMEAYLVDDFNDPIDHGQQAEALRLHVKAGVTVHQRDVVEDGLPFDRDSLDVITTFDSIEHWHHSPKRLLQQCLDSLRPGGWLVIGAPNCVNLRKRITVPIGVGKWSAMQDWYEQPRFRGHVREPDVQDLRYIAADLGLDGVRIMGRNWQGYVSQRVWVRRSTATVDRVLRLRPSLCSDIYLMGRRPLRRSSTGPSRG